MTHKNLRVEEHVHKLVKLEAVKADMQIKEFIEMLITDYINKKENAK